MALTLGGLALLAFTHAFGGLLVAAGLVGLGSAVFHPEASRVARLASGGRYVLAQSAFQVGGNAGTALGPLLAAFVVVPRGQGSVAWFCLAALAGMTILAAIGRWYAGHLAPGRKAAHRAPTEPAHGLSSPRIVGTIAILLTLIFPSTSTWRAFRPTTPST